MVNFATHGPPNRRKNLALSAIDTYHLNRTIRTGAIALQKLTLSADETTIEKAKKLAEEEGTSVSAMFVRFVRLLHARRAEQPVVGLIASKATGIIKFPDGKPEREILEEALDEKYGIEQ